ncbi:MAG: hypothetical protein AAF467_26540 [Actinomycetota bacterium]
MMEPKVLDAAEMRSEDVAAVYRGDADALVLRGQIADSVLRDVAERFWSQPPRRRPPPAAGYEVGTHHFNKTLSCYFDEVGRTAADLAATCGFGADPFDLIRRKLERCLSEAGLRFRIARHAGREAAPIILRSWESELGDNRFDLGPHDDAAQLNDSKQRGFEIQDVDPGTLVAVNICVDRRFGGDLVVWTVRGNADVRRLAGSREYAYPYPVDWLDTRPSVRIKMQVGDVVLLRGELVHAVTKSPKRVVASFFTGKISPDTVVYWS